MMPENMLGDAVLVDIAERLKLVSRSVSPAQAAARAETIALSLTSGAPPRDLFILLAAVAIVGAAACTARDLARERARVERQAADAAGG